MMNRRTASSQEAGDRPATLQAASPAGASAVPDRLARSLSWAALAGIIPSVLIMIAVAAIRDSWEKPYIKLPPGGPPWGLSPHVSLTLVSAGMWTAAVLGGGGVLAGLAAIARGARPSPRLLLAVGLIAVAALTVLPPAGSTDALDDAAYGRIAVLGHSPYAMTPAQLVQAHDPVGLATPAVWRRQVTLYGPLATAQQWAAAELGGTSAARIVLWLKIWNGIAFAAVALALNRILRSDRSRRARAHLLWSANPLLLWVLAAEGHVEVLAAGLGVVGLALARVWTPARKPEAARWLAAGLLAGAAADVKISYLLFVFGLAWAARRSRGACLAALAGAALVLAPTYWWFGAPAIKVLFARDYLSSVDNFYQLFAGSYGHYIPHQVVLAMLLSAVVGLLMLWRLPGEVPGLPAVRPALALSVAWLFFWPYTLPWYDAMAFCLLALYPASRLDWLALVQLTAGAFALMPGNAGLPAQHLLRVINNGNLYWVTPAVLLAVAAALVYLCVTGRWKIARPFVMRDADLPLRSRSFSPRA
jgi:hypothetical protein